MGLALVASNAFVGLTHTRYSAVESDEEIAALFAVVAVELVLRHCSFVKAAVVMLEY